MNNSPNPHTSVDMQIDGISIRAAFWKNDRDGHICSILKMQSRCWDVQLDATPEELCSLSSMLENHARQVRAAIEEQAAADLARQSLLLDPAP